MPSPRFVILEHRIDGVHWDVMLERGAALRTWAVDAPLVAGAGLPARSLSDHRVAYLEYEGPIAGGRGSVRRVAGGSYEVIAWGDDRVVVALRGDQLSGVAELSRRGGDGWVFRLEGNVD